MLIHLSKIALKRLIEFLAIAIILFAVLLNIGRITMPMLKQKRQFFENWASQVLQQPVQIGKIQAGWHRFEPVVSFSNVIVKKPVTNNTVIHIQKLSIGINILASLWHGKLLPAHIHVSGANLTVLEDQHGEFIIKGVPAAAISMQSVTAPKAAHLKDMLIWLLTKTNVSLDHINIDWHASNGVILPFKNVSLNIADQGAKRRIIGIAKLQQTPLTIFKFVLESSDINHHNLNATMYLQADRLSLHQWSLLSLINQFMPDMQIKQGELNGKFWLTWKAGKFSKLQSLVQVRQAKLFANTEAAKPIKIDHFSANMAWQRNKTGWQFAANHIKLQVNHKIWPENQFGYRVSYANRQHPQYQIMKLKFLHLQGLRNLLQHVSYLPDNFQQLLRNFKPKGNLKNLVLAWWKNKNNKKKLILKSQFQNFSLSPWQHIPGLTHITGKIYSSPQGGFLQVNGKQTTIQFPFLFSQPLQHINLAANVIWQKQQDNWYIRVKHYQIADKNLRSYGKIQLIFPPKQKPIIDLLAGFHVLDLHQIKHYLPDKILNPTLDHWLNTAFLHGQLREGKLLFRGPLADFPYDNHRGKFVATAKMQDVSLHYAPKWPALSHTNGTLTFANRKMIIHGQQSLILQNPISDLTAEIADLQHPKLIIHAQSYSDLNDGLDFLRHSPLKIAKQLASLSLQGPMHLNLNLNVNLNRDHTTVQSEGDIQVKQGNLNLPNWRVALNQINGDLAFTNADLSAHNLQARLWGEPIHLNLTTAHPKNKAAVIQVEMGGKLNSKQLQRNFHLDLFKSISGVTPFRALLKLYSQGSNQLNNQLNLITDLRGLSIQNVPEPFKKSAKVSRLLHLQLDFNKNDKLGAKLQYGKALSAALLMKQYNQQLQLHAANIHFGAGKVNYPQQAGIAVNGILPVANIGEWRMCFSHFFKNNKKMHTMQLNSLPIRQLELEIKQLLWKQLTLQHVYLKLIPNSSNWRLNIQNKDIAGILTIPKQTAAIWHAHLHHLYLPQLQFSKKKSAKNVIDPAQIPPLDITIGDFRYHGLNYGQVRLSTTPAKHGMKINKLDTRSSLFVAHLSGYWDKFKSQQKSALIGDLQSNDFGKLLTLFKITKRLGHGKGALTFNLHWRGTPYGMNAKSLFGQFKIKIKNGVILQLGKGVRTELGFGRLLNFFSIESIFKRLTLNFSDFTEKGFRFNILNANFHFNKGIATTDYSYFDGPVAKVILRGGFDLIHQRNNLKMTVNPYVTSSIPLIAGIAGGPIVGAVTWLVNKIISPGISRAIGSTYHVTGSWAKPKIVKEDNHKSRIAKKPATRKA